MAIHFGLATMRMDGRILGHLQNVSVDMSFDSASLYSGKALFPVDVRVHTGTITGSAEFADLTAIGVEKILGGARTGTAVALNNLTSPSTWQLELSLTTDSTTFTITLNKCRATSLNFPFVRDGHVVPNFDFAAEADSDGNVGTIELGDIS